MDDATKAQEFVSLDMMSPAAVCSLHSVHVVVYTARESDVVRTKEMQKIFSACERRGREGRGVGAGGYTHFKVINLPGCQPRRQQIVLAVIREILMHSSIMLY